MKQEIKEIRLSTDVLVIGSGMAGMFAAIKAKEHGLDVILTDKNFVGRSGGSHYAEGDIIFFRPQRGHVMEDWKAKICRDTEYVNNPDWNEIVFAESEARYEDLVRYGVTFYTENGEIRVDGPHKFSNIPKMYEIISMKNREYLPALRKHAQMIGVRVYDRIMCCELLKQDGKIVGVMGFHTTSGKLYIIKAKATIIATGAGTAYKSRAMNTDYWTGDGACMAYRAGAEIEGFEFRHTNAAPTRAQLEERAKIFQGGELQDKVIDITKKYPHVTLQSGWFWPTINAANEPAVWYGAGDIHAGKGPLYHDLTHWTEKLAEHHRSYFERVGSEESKLIGLDYFNGGLLHYPSARQELNTPIGAAGIWPINKYCQSSLPGLLAAGGSCATMMSGAKYGGMGLGQTGGAVTGARAAQGAYDYIQTLEDFELDEEMVSRTREIVTLPARRNMGHEPAWLTHVLQNTMVPYYVLIYKHEKRMQAAYTMVKFMDDELAPNLYAKDPHDWRMAYEVKNMLLNAQLQLQSSIYRKESRASHFREDYPRRCDPEWLVWVIVKKDENGEMVFRKEPIPERFWPDLSKPYEQRYLAKLPLEDQQKEVE